MKIWWMIFGVGLLAGGCKSGKLEFDDYPVYTGPDLGLTYSQSESVFKVWSPPAEAVELRLYDNDSAGLPTRTLPLAPGENGVWEVRVPGNLFGAYYTFRAKHQGNWLAETPDLYAVATGANGQRAQVLDLDALKPDGWDTDQWVNLESPVDAVIYEMHLRDFSIDSASGMAQKGKYLAVAESSTAGPGGVTTGLDHLAELGVTHVHVLPMFDFWSVDETRNDQYNWGYDPQHYNVPEGSYATDPHRGSVRIREARQMVQALHSRGIGVVMDVVYNHTGRTAESSFNLLVPGYYYRQREDGSFSDASACGNETASDRPMMRKYMIESLVHWMTNYHIDGFRFDLMAIHDIETMQAIADTLRAINPSVLLYGEGWTASDSPLPEERRALKKNIGKLNGVAAFSDDMRDGLKGSVFEHEHRGYVAGNLDLRSSVMFGVAAATAHPGVNLEEVNYSTAVWANHPDQCVNYASCHDNHTLRDKLAISTSEPDSVLKRMQVLALGAVLTAQGIPFLHAGCEMMRTRYGVENAYNSPDSINAILWSWKRDNAEVYSAVRDLIAMRKNHPAFRMRTAEAVAANLRFLEGLPAEVLAWELNGAAVGDSWSRIQVVMNVGAVPYELNLGTKMWRVAFNGKAYADPASSAAVRVQGEMKIPARHLIVLVEEEAEL